MQKRLSMLSSTSLWFPHVRELAIVVAAYFAYMYTRALVFSDFKVTALDNAKRVIEFEKSVGFFWEAGWQSWAINSATELVIVFNWAYIITFWPIIMMVGITLYITNRVRYKYYRNIVLISFGIALAGFMAFPLAPPRMMAEHFVDTINTFGPSGYASREFANYYNAYAAMPSLHFSWTVMFGILFLTTPNKWIKVFGVIYPTMTLFAITITANHYIMDAIGGGLLVIASFVIMELGIRRRLFMARLVSIAANLLRRGRSQLGVAGAQGAQSCKQNQIQGKGRSVTSG